MNNLVRAHFIQLSNNQLEIRSSHNQLFLLCNGEFSWYITHSKKMYDISIMIINMVITNSCALGRLSSRLLGSSPLSILEIWSSPKFNQSGLIIISKSNFWKRRSHHWIFPPNTRLLTKYFNAKWSVYILKCPPSKYFLNFSSACTIDEPSLSFVV